MKLKSTDRLVLSEMTQNIKSSLYSLFIKRFLDIVLSALALIGFSWLYFILYLVIKIDDPGPVLFFQKRVGKKKNGELTFFRLAKFRSMKISTPCDVPTHQLQNSEQYITKIGRILRNTSFDELPQIVQIFTGKMSIVGPRPALWNQNDLIFEREKYGANDVKPGLTGWAQVNGRDELEIGEKAKLDGEYAQHISFKMDCICFCMTVVNVIKRKDIVEGDTDFMQKQVNQQPNSVVKSRLNE